MISIVLDWAVWYICTMFAKKPTSPSPPPDRGYRKELEYLHARKSAVESLIQSLEDYDRFRATRADNRKRKTGLMRPPTSSRAI
jgi:hypothetical protein